MKKKLMVALLLAALFAAPAASAEDFRAVSNPLDLLFSWVVSLWDTLDGARSDLPPGFDTPDDEENPGLPDSSPFLDPHG